MSSLRLVEILKSGDVAQALTQVAEIAATNRHSAPTPLREKRAAPEWLKSLGATASQAGNRVTGLARKAWEDPTSRAALVGGGLGMAGGATMSLLDKRRRKGFLGNVLTGGLLGSAIGGGGRLAYDRLIDSSRGNEERQQRQQERATQATRAQDSYNELGRLGFDTKKTQDIVGQLHKDPEVTPEAVAQQMKQQRGSIKEQLQNIPEGTWQAGRAGDVQGAIAHADVLGLKNVNPFGQYFDETTAAAALGGNVLGRSLGSGGRVRNLLGRLGDTIADRYGKPYLDPKTKQPIPGRGNLPYANELGKALKNRQARMFNEELRHKFDEPKKQLEQRKVLAELSPKAQMAQIRQWRTQRHNEAPVGRYGRLAGRGVLPTLGLLAPLLAREWGDSGYRSGERPVMSITEANQILSGRK